MSGVRGHNPIVGRPSEVAALTEHVDELFDGGFSVLAVEGEAGIGKTLLVDALVDQARGLADTVTVEREISVSAAKLWASIADVTRMAEWSPENVGATWLDGAAPGSVGSRFEGTNRNGRKTWKTIGTVVASEPGQAFAFRIKAGPLSISEWNYTFEQSRNTTRVVETWRDQRNVLARLVAPFVTGVEDRGTHNRATMEQTLDTLKAQAEATTHP